MWKRKALPERLTISVLHLGFALTGVLHSIGGPLLPSLASSFHLNDNQSGALLSLYFAGTSLGALMCVGRYAVLTTFGFVGVMAACFAAAAAPASILQLVFLMLGISVGVPMSAISMYTGRKFGEHSAAPLTFLNFSWSAGALAAPLLAARLLVHHTYRATYWILGVAAAVAFLASWLALDEPEAAHSMHAKEQGRPDVPLIALFAFMAFLGVGIENTSVTWLATYSMRTSGTGAAVAAASSSLYWWGYLITRGISALLLLRADAMRILRIAAVTAACAALLLVGWQGALGRSIAMLVLGAALAPIFPLLLARFFACSRRPSDSRWVLALCGFGGSVVPWFTGWISARSGDLRMALLIVPVALFLMLCLLPLLRGRGAVPGPQAY